MPLMPLWISCSPHRHDDIDDIRAMFEQSIRDADHVTPHGSRSNHVEIADAEIRVEEIALNQDCVCMQTGEE